MRYEIYTYILGNYAGQLNAANAFRLLYSSDALAEILRRYDVKARVSVAGAKAFIYFFDRQLMVDSFSIQGVMDNYVSIDSQFSDSLLSEGAKDNDMAFIRNVLAVVADIKDGFYAEFPGLVRDQYNAAQTAKKERR